MAPPAKRRRHNVVHVSDDEEQEAKSQGNTLANFLLSSPDQRNATRPESTSPSLAPKRASKSSAAASQPQKSTTNLQLKRNGHKTTNTSPEKPKVKARTNVKSKIDSKGQTADLKTLFSKQAERAPKVSSANLDDIISDPISDEDEVGEHRATLASRVGNNARKRFRDGIQSSTQSSAGVASTGGQIFRKPPRPLRDPNLHNDQRPWSEQFGPKNFVELAVHKRKVADVRKWLEDAMAGRMRQRLLILKGAAGTGKTTTVRLLAKDMHCELLEWKNPTGSLGANVGFQSQSAQFEEFLGRGGKFGQLDTDLDIPAVSNSDSTRSKDGLRKIILIEEFPNTFARNSTALESFRNAIMQYLATNAPSLANFGQQSSKEPITPVVMVVSETLLTTTSASADSLTTHRLLGPGITRHPGACMIEFNAVAPTLLASALELIVQKEARKSGRKRTPGPQVLKRLGEIGDIRSAVSSLEFLCLKGDADADWGSKVTFTKPKRGAKDDKALTKGEEESLELISRREASLGIFHAVGKVMYNKRDESPMADGSPEGRAEILPGYMAHHARPKLSQVSVNSLMDETGTDTHTFVSSLHENYVLSCDAVDRTGSLSSIDYVNNCIDYLSESDLLCPSSDIFFGGRGFGAGGSWGKDSGSHVLRQDEIAFQAATRGILFSLPHPVKRIGTASGRGGGDAFKMFYPTSLKLWREKEELEGVVDHWSTKLLKGEETTQTLTDGASAFRKPKTTSSGDLMSKQSSQRPNSQRRESEQGQSSAAPLLSLGSSARRELLLERLPYMAHIARRRKASFNSFRLKEIEKVVSFSGLHATSDEEAAEGDEVNAVDGDAWATDKPTEEVSPRKKGIGIRETSNESVSALPVQRLVLSDDDIEDD